MPDSTIGRDRGSHSLGIQYSTTACRIRGRRYCGDDRCGWRSAHDACLDIRTRGHPCRRRRHGSDLCWPYEIDRGLRASSSGKHRLACHAPSGIRKYPCDDDLNCYFEPSFVARWLERSSPAGSWGRPVADCAGCSFARSHRGNCRAISRASGSDRARLDSFFRGAPGVPCNAVLCRSGRTWSCGAHDRPALDGG